jgi:hypothetical protein
MKPLFENIEKLEKKIIVHLDILCLQTIFRKSKHFYVFCVKKINFDAPSTFLSFLYRPYKILHFSKNLFGDIKCLDIHVIFLDIFYFKILSLYIVIICLGA